MADGPNAPGVGGSATSRRARLPMHRTFEVERFDRIQVERVHVANYHFGRGHTGDLDVWIDRGPLGKRFLRQITVDGSMNAVTMGIYAEECYFLRERLTGRVFFLDVDDRGCYLQSDDFYGADAFLGDEAKSIRAWLGDYSDSHLPAPTV